MKANKTLMLIVSIVLLASFSVINTGATIKPAFAGDTDLDDIITVKDATLVQKFIAELENPNNLQKCVSEVDGDGVITVKDATMIQKKCAGLIDMFIVHEDIFRDVYIGSLTADYDSGKAMIGVPVTFTATGYGYGEPFYYQFIINDKIVTGLTTDNTYTCTFDEAGFYNIEVKILSSFDVGDQSILYNYEVVEPYKSETIMIKSFYHDKSPGPLYKHIGKTVFTAEAMFGSGDYEYAYYLDGELVQNYSAVNTFIMEDFEEIGISTLTLCVRDVKTRDIAKKDIILDIGDTVIG